MTGFRSVKLNDNFNETLQECGAADNSSKARARNTCRAHGTTDQGSANHRIGCWLTRWPWCTGPRHYYPTTVELMRRFPESGGYPPGRNIACCPQQERATDLPGGPMMAAGKKPGGMGSAGPGAIRE